MYLALNPSSYLLLLYILRKRRNQFLKTCRNIFAWLPARVKYTFRESLSLIIYNRADQWRNIAYKTYSPSFMNKPIVDGADEMHHGAS